MRFSGFWKYILWLHSTERQQQQRQQIITLKICFEKEKEQPGTMSFVIRRRKRQFLKRTRREGNIIQELVVSKAKTSSFSNERKECLKVSFIVSFQFSW
jgi:CRISPR-associated protein Cas8b1/Cst1 subtype I-B